MSQSQANESADSQEQTTSSTMSQSKPILPSSNYFVVPEQEGESDRPLNPFSQH